MSMNKTPKMWPMQVTNVNTKALFENIPGPYKKNNVNEIKSKDSFSDSAALGYQLNFIGLSHRTAVKPANTIIRAYLKNLEHYHNNNLPGINMLYKLIDPYAVHSPVILFKEITPFDKSLDFLTKTVSKIKELQSHKKTALPFKFKEIESENFELYKKAIDTGIIPNFRIKGMIGQGRDSTAFLTSDNKVIKLSLKPNFPDEDTFVEGIEIPILARYIAENVDGKGTRVYGVLEELTEVLSLRDPSSREFEAYANEINRRLEKINPDYELQDDNALQFGFIGNKLFLIDHQCIRDRKLFGED